MTVHIKEATSRIDYLYGGSSMQVTDVSLRIDGDIEVNAIEERFNQAFLGRAIKQCKWCNSGNAYDNGNCVRCGGPI